MRNGGRKMEDLILWIKRESVIGAKEYHQMKNEYGQEQVDRVLIQMILSTCDNSNFSFNPLSAYPFSLKYFSIFFIYLILIFLFSMPQYQIVNYTSLHKIRFSSLTHHEFPALLYLRLS